MLEELHVRDLALIEDVWLEFGPGLTVLTGETGAGKTALVGALKLLVGERADSTLVRAGADEALVEGRVRVGGTESVARRRVSSDGRSKCTLDGEMVTVGQLAEVLGAQFDLHGQHEHQALLSPAQHVGYLDRYVGGPASEALEGYRDALSRYRDDVAALRTLETRIADAEKRADYLRFVASEISSAAVGDGEDVELERRMPTLRHGEKLATAAGEAYAVLRADGGASDALGSALAALVRVQGLDPALDALADRLAEALVAVDELGSDLRDYGDSIEHDPAALDAAESRLATLSTLKKKYGPTLQDVLRAGTEAQSALAELEGGERGLAGARARAEDSRGALAEAAAALGEVRRGAVGGFVERLAAAVADLGMPDARFDIALTDLAFDAWDGDGPHRVEFLYAPGHDQPFRPLSKIASGGEVSRVMLALKSVLGDADRVPVLVFDEVDTGIGGATAVAVGRRLAELARSHQVLVVTHLAQVAVFADRHLVVEKHTEEGRIRTSVTLVEGVERTAEIARMLSGGDTAAGLAHAEELLASAGRSD